MKFAFISTTFPPDLARFVLGVHKRASMFIKAISNLADLEMLLYVDPRIPISSDYAFLMEQQLQNYWQIKLTLRLCHLAPYNPSNSWLRFYINPIFSVYNHSAFCRMALAQQVAAYEELLSHNPDAIFAHRLSSMCLINRSRIKPHQSIYFDLDDIEHTAFLRNLKQPPYWKAKHIFYLHVFSLLLAERAAIKRSRKTFVCSDNDRIKLSKSLKFQNIVTIPNAVEIRKKLPLPSQPTLLFLGTFGYQPNVIAANYLLSEIWPRIISTVPHAKLLIAGENPDQITAFRSNPPQVEFCGFVEDLDALYADTRVVCCPILSGGGTRIKILEASAYTRPVVSTHIGAEGLNFSDGKDILLRDDPASFADACISLLTNYDKATNISIAAYQTVGQFFDRSNIIQRITKELSMIN